MWPPLTRSRFDHGWSVTRRCNFNRSATIYTKNKQKTKEKKKEKKGKKGGAGGDNLGFCFLRTVFMPKGREDYMDKSKITWTEVNTQASK